MNIWREVKWKFWVKLNIWRAAKLAKNLCRGQLYIKKNI